MTGTLCVLLAITVANYVKTHRRAANPAYLAIIATSMALQTNVFATLSISMKVLHSVLNAIATVRPVK